MQVCLFGQTFPTLCYADDWQTRDNWSVIANGLTALFTTSALYRPTRSVGDYSRSNAHTANSVIQLHILSFKELNQLQNSCLTQFKYQKSVDCFELVKPINRDVYTRSLHWWAVDGVELEWLIYINASTAWIPLNPWNIDLPWHYRQMASVCKGA
jgi:hypothetical protein